MHCVGLSIQFHWRGLKQQVAEKVEQFWCMQIQSDELRQVQTSRVE